MKKILFVFKSIRTTALIGLISLCAQKTAHAQPPPAIVTPTLPDNVWYTTPSGITGLATGMIAYGNGRTIYASTALVSGSNSIYVKDDAVGSTSVTATNSVSSPLFDIVIGNWDGVSTGCTSCLSPSTDYILACAYSTGGSTVEIDYYDVYDDGISTVSVNPLPALTSTTSPGLYNSTVVHMDLIAEAGNKNITGRPFCNKFVVTWDDASGNVFAANGSLNAPPATLTGTQLTVNTSGRQPDVAAIQRNGFAPPNPIHDIGIFTFAGSPTLGSQAVYMTEVDYTTGATSAIATLDLVTSSMQGFNWPRIDAIDDYNINQGTTTSNYKIVVGVHTGTTAAGGDEARTYDNLMVGLTPPYYETTDLIDVTTLPPPYSSSTPGYLTDMPVVAYGPGPEYEIFHHTNYLAPTMDSNIMFLERIDLSNPQSLVGNNYYWVNSDGAPLHALSNVHGTSISAPVNEPDLASVFAWSSQISASPMIFGVSYKTIGTSYAFKQAPTSVSNVQDQQWQAYPNPAKDELVLKTQGDHSANEYRILDVVGRTVLKGPVKNNTQHIDISKLNTGNYIIRLYCNDVKTQNMTFVKE